LRRFYFTDLTNFHFFHAVLGVIAFFVVIVLIGVAVLLLRRSKNRHRQQIEPSSGGASSIDDNAVPMSHNYGALPVLNDTSMYGESSFSNLE
jgi:predicted lipid-binding transport protein (Tim44 family)